MTGRIWNRGVFAVLLATASTGCVWASWGNGPRSDDLAAEAAVGQPDRSTEHAARDFSGEQSSPADAAAADHALDRSARDQVSPVVDAAVADHAPDRSRRDQPQPVVDQPQPVVDQPQPVVDQPQPVVDAAVPTCLIAGKSYLASARDPADSTQCRICDPTVSTTAWSPASGCAVTFAGTGTAGSVNGPLATASFNKPRGIVVDAQGVFYVADEGNYSIRKIADGQVTKLTGGQGFADGALSSAKFASPHGLAIGSGSTLYVADEGNHRIRMIANGQVTTVAGTGTAGFVNGAAASARFNTPIGVAVDSQGAIYVADWLNYCIRKIASGQVSTFAGVCGTAGYVDGAAASARFSIPSGMELDAAGGLYVADEGNNRVRLIANGQVSTAAGSAKGFTNGAATTARLNGPTNVELEPSGALLIADMFNDAIRRLSAGQLTTVAGTGTTGATDGPLASATFNSPSGIAVWKGVAYVADGANHRIRALRLP